MNCSSGATSESGSRKALERWPSSTIPSLLDFLDAI